MDWNSFSYEAFAKPQYFRRNIALNAMRRVFLIKLLGFAKASYGFSF